MKYVLSPSSLMLEKISWIVCHLFKVSFRLLRQTLQFLKIVDEAEKKFYNIHTKSYFLRNYNSGRKAPQLFQYNDGKGGKILQHLCKKYFLCNGENEKHTSFFLVSSLKKKKKSFTRFEKESQQRGQHKLFPRTNDKGKKTFTRFTQRFFN